MQNTTDKPSAELVGLEALQTSAKITRYFLRQELNFLLNENPLLHDYAGK